MSLDDALKRLREDIAGEPDGYAEVSIADLREVLEHHAGMRAIVEGPDLAAGSLLGVQVIVTHPGSGRQWAGWGYAQAWHPTIVIQDSNGITKTLPLAWACRAEMPQPLGEGIVVGSTVTWPAVDSSVVRGKVVQQANQYSQVKWADGSGPTWHSTSGLLLVPQEVGDDQS